MQVANGAAVLTSRFLNIMVGGARASQLIIAIARDVKVTFAKSGSAKDGNRIV